MLWQIISFLLSPIIFLAVLLAAFAVRDKKIGKFYKKTDSGEPSTDAYEFFRDMLSPSKNNKIFAGAMIIFLILNAALMVFQGMVSYNESVASFAGYSEEYEYIFSNIVWQNLMLRLIIPVIMMLIALVFLIWIMASTKAGNRKTDNMLNLLNENGMLIDAYNDYMETSAEDAVVKNLFADCLLGSRYIFSISQKLIVPLEDVDHWYPMNVKNMKAAVLCRKKSRDTTLLFGNQKVRDDFTSALDEILRRYRFDSGDAI